jgi:hypothetical protein
MPTYGHLFYCHYVNIYPGEIISVLNYVCCVLVTCLDKTVDIIVVKPSFLQVVFC